jgi:hypothetical protein
MLWKLNKCVKKRRNYLGEKLSNVCRSNRGHVTSNTPHDKTHSGSHSSNPLFSNGKKKNRCETDVKQHFENQVFTPHFVCKSK